MWQDGFFAERVADPDQAAVDVRQAHQWITRELERATNQQRLWHLTQEQKRLAAIAWRLHSLGARLNRRVGK